MDESVGGCATMLLRELEAVKIMRFASLKGGSFDAGR